MFEWRIMKILIVLCFVLIGCGPSFKDASIDLDAGNEAGTFMCPPNDSCVRWYFAGNNDCWSEFATRGIPCDDGGVCDGEGYCSQ